MEENKIKISAIKIRHLGGNLIGKTAVGDSIMGLEFCLDTLATISS